MKKPFAVLSDLHLHNWSAFSKVNEAGVNSRLAIILEEIEHTWGLLASAGGNTLYLAGDLFHVRGAIAPSVLNPTLELFNRLIKQGAVVRIIPGNHDLESAETCALTNAVQSLEMLGCTICNEPTHFVDDNVVMLPWYPKLADLQQKMTEYATRAPGSTLIIHAPMNGVIAGIPDHGLDPAQVAMLGYERVLVGHYHNHMAFAGNVYSIGATTHQTWGDVGTLAGWLLVGDTLQHIPSRAPSFVDFDFSPSADNDAIERAVKGNYVRAKLGEADESELRAFRELLEGLGAAGVVIHAQAMRIGPTRPGTAAGGTSSVNSIEQSISAWISTNHAAATPDEVLDLEAECLSILEESDLRAANAD